MVGLERIEDLPELPQGVTIPSFDESWAEPDELPLEEIPAADSEAVPQAAL